MNIRMLLILGWVMLGTPVWANTEVVNDISNRATIVRKLQSIVIDKVNFEKLDIATVLDFLQQKSKELDPDHQGINFVLKLASDDPTDAPAGTATREIHRQVSMTLENVPLSELLDYIVEQTHLQYTVEDHAVYFRPSLEAQPSIVESTNSDLDRKLKGIYVSLDFNNATIEEALNFLRVKSKDLDPDKKGINFIIDPDASASAKPITLTLNNVPLDEAIRYACQLANVKYKVEAYAIHIVPSDQNANEH